MVEKIERKPLRDVWTHEAYDFTTWLERNIDVVNDVLEIELTGVEKEKSTGDFKVDLLAEDSTGNPVIIENQFGKSDHEHLGKTLTYLTGLEAEAAIWIAEDPRQEHIRAFGWLNESASADFFLLKLEAIQIGDSEPAPLFTPIVEPSEESREIGKKKQEFAERDELRYEFWEELLSRANKKTDLHSSISAQPRTRIGTGAGISGLTYQYVIRQNSANVELYIKRTKRGEDEPQEIYDKLKANKDAIEERFGGSLSWERLDGKMACRIAKYFETGGYRDDNWEEVQEEMIEGMIKFHQALEPEVEKLDF